jgi:hypothetical protein
MTEMIPEQVLFISVEDEEDDTLLLSFALDMDDDDVVSLILSRDLQDHRLLPPEERGVSVSHELSLDPDDEDDLLRRISITRRRVAIETARQRYDLDVSRVDRTELREAGALLRRMNFDHCFVLEISES